MALERVPADIRKDGGVARMSDPKVSSFYMVILRMLKCSLFNLGSDKFKFNWLNCSNKLCGGLKFFSQSFLKPVEILKTQFNKSNVLPRYHQGWLYKQDSLLMLVSLTISERFDSSLLWNKMKYPVSIPSFMSILFKPEQ